MSQNLRTMGLNPIAEFADASLRRSMGANMSGEIPGQGKPWSCQLFGKYGHNASSCIHCITNFMEDKGAGK